MNDTPELINNRRITLQRFISAVVVASISFAGLETLIYINNLYQPVFFIQVSGLIYLILLIWLYFIFDLHFKEKIPGPQTLLKALSQRFKYFSSYRHIRYFQNHLILPGIIYWSAIILIGINFGHYALQHFIALSASLALVVALSLFKEVFRNKNLPIHNSHFIALSYVKIYASWLAYASSLGIIRYYCYKPFIFYAVVFLLTLMLLYQALFQLHEYKARHLGLVVFCALLLSAVSYFVYRIWNVNYFSAGLFMTAIYNFLWNLLHNRIKKTLTVPVFLEQLAILFLFATMIVGSTNFRAFIERCSF